MRSEWPVVRLTEAEQWAGVEEGLWRAQQVIPSTVETARDHQLYRLYQCRGACAEIALSRWSGLPWTSRRRLSGADVGLDLDAKSRVGEHARLILNADDPDWLRYVLVVAAAPLYGMVGWSWGHRAKVQGAWLLDRWRGRVCYVPQAALSPADTLMDGYGVRTCRRCWRLVPWGRWDGHPCTVASQPPPLERAPQEGAALLLRLRNDGEPALCGGCGAELAPGDWRTHRCPRR